MIITVGVIQIYKHSRTVLGSQQLEPSLAAMFTMMHIGNKNT